MYTSAPSSRACAQGSPRRRANTTNAMFISHTLETPNREQIISCIAKSMHYAIALHANERSSGREIEIFNEKKFPLVRWKRNYERIPSLDEIGMFIKFWFYKQALSPQVGIMAIHYIDLLIHKTGFLITPMNWRRILICALMVADKVWEEDIVCNSDYINDAFPLLTVEDLNAMERKFLLLLDFKLVVKTSVYAEYYFALRSIIGLECFPARPLDKDTADQLLSTGSSTIPKRRRSFSAESMPDFTKERPEETTALSFEQFCQRKQTSIPHSY